MALSDGEIQPDTKIQCQSKTEFRSKPRSLNRSLPNSHTPTQSRNVYFATSNIPNPIQHEVRNKSRSKSQDRHEIDTRNMYSSVTEHRQWSRNLNRSPSNYRTQTQHVGRNRSRSRSYDEQTFDSRSTYSSKNRKRSQSRIRNKSRSKSPYRKDDITEHQYLPKPKSHRQPKISKNYKLKINMLQKQEAQKKSQYPFKKWKKPKSTQLTEEVNFDLKYVY